MQNICYLSQLGRLNQPVLLCILVLIMPYRFTVFEQNILTSVFSRIYSN